MLIAVRGVLGVGDRRQGADGRAGSLPRINGTPRPTGSTGCWFSGSTGLLRLYTEVGFSQLSILAK